MERTIFEIFIDKVAKKQYPSGIGLFAGQSGILLALESLPMPMLQDTESIAENLLDCIIEKMKTLCDTSFDQGLAGIGYVMNEIHKSKRINGDIDNILENVDAAIYRLLTNERICVPTGITNGALGYLIYLISRLDNDGHNTDSFSHSVIIESIKICLNNICNNMPSRFYNLSRDISISLLWDYPICIYLIGKLIEKDILSHKLKYLIKSWLFYFSGLIPYYNLNKLYLGSALSFIQSKLRFRELDNIIANLFYAVDIRQTEEEISRRILNINEGWPFASFVISKSVDLLPHNHIRYPELSNLKQKIDSSTGELLRRGLQNKLDLSLINGISGVLYLNSYTHLIPKKSDL